MAKPPPPVPPSLARCLGPGPGLPYSDDRALLLRSRPSSCSYQDSKFIAGFDEVFKSEGVRVIRLPYRAPPANAYSERWVGSVRREVLDHLLIFGRRRRRLPSRTSPPQAGDEFVHPTRALRAVAGFSKSRPAHPRSPRWLARREPSRESRLAGVGTPTSA